MIRGVNIFPPGHCHAVSTKAHSQYLYGMIATSVAPSFRKKEITKQYLVELDKHIADLKEGKIDRAKEIRDFAAILHIHPVHLSNTVKEVTGLSTCDLYENRLLSISKELLLNTSMSIAAIARQLTYDPSNFTKFFKAFTGITPKQFRENNR